MQNRVTDTKNSTTQCWALDPKLTLKAKGLLTLLSTHEAGFTMTEALALSRDGRDATRAAFGELLETGYITRHDSRDEHNRYTGVTYRLAAAGQPT